MADTSKITLKQLKDAMNKAKKYTDNEIAGVTGVSKVEPEELDMPKVFFNGDKPTNKTSVHATIEYISKNEHFKGYVDIKCQGNSSMAYPKKNYTIKMFKDEARSTKLKKDFKGWGKQSKFCLKANYIDHSHARNIISAKLWGQVVKSRSDFDTLPEELKTSPNYGAVDGFPIKVYYNNTYEGVYTWNIPKDGWMNNMDDKLNTHCILCGEEYNSGCFRSANASLWSDELHDVMPANIVTSFNNFQSFVINSSDDEFKTGLSTYADVNSLIDYYIFQYVICGLDSMGKNQLFFTYDGIKWIASSYDMDSTFGMYWNGQSFVSATYRMQEDYESMTSGRPGNLLYIRMEEIFYDEIKARYAELRAGVLSYANIVNEFERFMDVIGKDLYAEDLRIYTGIPSGNTNNIQQIRNYTRDRLTYVDTQIEALRKLIPCTGIVLSADTLSFTTTDTQTLSVVVSPDNTTDTVNWSVSPSGIVTVNNGVVTPVSNGTCTITATCGSYSDTCAVTVSGMSESGGDTDIYTTAEYAITEPRTFNGTSDYIDTGIKLFDTAKTFTIFIDYASNTPTANSKATIFHCLHEQAPSYRGLCLMEDGNNDRYFIGGQVTGNQYVGGLPSTGKYLISFVNGVINNVVTLNNSNELVHSATDMASANPYAQISENLLIGCYQDASGTKGRFWSGTINKFGVWYKQLTENEINQVFGKNGGGTDTTLLYSLPEETVFNATSTYIDTGVALLSTDQDFTIALDVTPAASQVNNYATIFHCMHEESPYPGLAFMAYNTNNTFYIPKGNNSSIIGQGPYLISESIRTKVVIIKEGTTLSAYSSNSVTGSSNYTYTQVSENLLIGAYQTTNGTKGRYFSGIIHDFKIYNKVFTSEEKDAYLNTSTGTNILRYLK